MTSSQSFPNLSKFEVLHAATVLNTCEVLRNAGLVFCPSHLAEQRRQQGGTVEFNGPDVGFSLAFIAFCWSTIVILGGGFNFIKVFHPPFGKDSQFDEHIFQMGWFNHQLGDIWSPHFCDIFRQFLEWSWNLQTCSHKVKWRKAVMWRIWATLQRVSFDVVVDLCTNYTIINHHLCMYIDCVNIFWCMWMCVNKYCIT